MTDVERESLFVVGVGSSAGGLDALTLFLRNLGEPSEKFAMIVCQHVSPDYKSRLTEILQHSTEWPVTRAEDGALLDGGRIYVTPPNNHIVLSDHRIALERYDGDKPVPSIDRLFMSLADEIGNRAIGIILSGTGRDGSEGMRAINLHNGCTLVQEPGDATHADMPRSVIRDEVYDKILLAQNMPHEIHECIINFELIRKGPQVGDTTDDLTEQEVQRRILDLLERRTGTNFAKYKPSTIFRRVDKRLEALNLDDKRAYLRYIGETPKELNRLFETVLIGVTEFFRNEVAFAELEAQIRKMIARRDPGDKVIRIWSVGTSTGEEAYSIAMIVREVLGDEFARYHCQIFATDIDERSLAAARKGHYPHATFANVPQAYRDRYFRREQSHYEATKQLRSMVLFSRHDISTDPPFLHLDLVSCRNLLIYFDDELQEEVLTLFHYALKEDAILFLGKSESVSPCDDLFDRIKAGQKIFRRLSASGFGQYRSNRIWSRHKPGFPTTGGAEHDSGTASAKTPHKSLREQAQESYFALNPHPYVVVNHKKDILEIAGNMGRYTELRTGAGNLDLIKLVNPELSLELRALLSKSESTGGYTSSYVIKFEHYGETLFVRIHVYPIAQREGERHCCMIVFEDVDPEQVVSNKTGGGPGDDSERVIGLEHELATVKEHLALFTEELETSNEELQTLNEELQSTNEELKSSNEEFETSNEELQSTNEELQSANQELRITNVELAEKEEELRVAYANLERNRNLYHSLANNFPDGSMSIIDRDYNIAFIRGKLLDTLGFVPANLEGVNIFKFLDRPGGKTMREVLSAAFAGELGSGLLSYKERSLNLNAVQLERNAKGRVTRVLLISSDVTAVTDATRLLERSIQEKAKVISREKAARLEADRQRGLITQLFESAPAIMAIVKGPEFRYELVNSSSGSFQRDQELIGKSFYEVLPELRGSVPEEMLRRAYETGESQRATAVELRYASEGEPDLEDGYFDVSFIPTRGADGEVDGVIFFGTDVTEVVLAKQVLERDAERLREMVDSLPVMAWTESPAGVVDFYNQRWYAITGDVSPVSDSPLPQVVDRVYGADVLRYEEALKAGQAAGKAYALELRIVSDNEEDGRWHLIRVTPIHSAERDLVYWIGVAVNVHAQKLLDLRKSEFLDIASHELRTPLTAIKGYHELLRESALASDPEAELYLDTMGGAIRRVNKLISELLSVSRIESGKLELELDRYRLKDVVGEALKGIGERAHRIEVEVNDDVPVHVDRDRVIQVIENLVSNAVKFSPPNSPIELRIGRAGRFGYLSVTDHGVGISASERERVFDRYFRSDVTHSVEGLGLGLYITRQIMIQHGGALRLESEVGSGSTFTVTFPLAGAPTQPVTAAHETDSHL